jgi:dipeptide/tripeptide permease
MKTRSTIILGVVLIALGVLALAYQGITYTKREKILDIGPLQATAEREKTISLPPLVGGLSLAGGIALVIIGAVKSRP